MCNISIVSYKHAAFPSFGRSDRIYVFPIRLLSTARPFRLICARSLTMGTSFSPLARAALTLGSAAVAFSNPARADMVALLGDLTSAPILPSLVARLRSTAEGRQMLDTLTPTRFPEHGLRSLPSLRELPAGSLGREYARFMDSRGFSPESRHLVRFVEDPCHRWVLQRYRDVHDLWHVLTGMPTTVLGELAQKWFEASQTALPVAVLSAAVGPLRLKTLDRRVLVTHLIPWAVSSGRRADDLLAIRYEDYLHLQVSDLRETWHITLPGVSIKDMKQNIMT